MEILQRSFVCANECAHVHVCVYQQSQCPLHPMHVQNIQNGMQYEVSILSSTGYPTLKYNPLRNYKPAHKIYINNKHYVNKWMLKHLLGMTWLIHDEQIKQFAVLCCLHVQITTYVVFQQHSVQ
jgi:hypothetical protein